MHGSLPEIVALIIVAGALAQWLAWRFRIPAIVLLTIVGAILGPGTGLIHPHDTFGDLLKPAVHLAVAVILFEGGLNLHLHELHQAGSGVRRLVTSGLVFSFVLGSAAAHYVGGLSWPVACEFGAIIVVTGPTVIMPLLRQARLRARPASLLKWEGIVNDPLGAVLAVVVFQYALAIEHDEASLMLVARVGASLVAAGLLGWASGVALAASYRRGWVPEYLKGPCMLAVVLATYALGNMLLEEAGLLTVTVLGIALGNANLPSIEEMRRFKENITIVLVSMLFVVLTADLDPELLRQLDWRGAALIAAVIFIVRPLAITFATAGSDLSWQERVLVGWIAPRGIVAAAVAGAFSARLAEAGFAGAEMLLPLIFALIVATVVLHGFSLPWVGRRLDLAARRRDGLLIVGASPWSIDLVAKLHGLEVPVVLADASWHRLRPARLAGLPVFFGQAMSESADATLDLSPVGYVFAATDNDAYNALVCTRFSSEFNRNAVFQLPLPVGEADEHRGLTTTLRGRQAFGSEAVYDTLLQRYFEGWRFQKTRLSEEFDLAAYDARYGATRVAMVVVRANGTLVFKLDGYSARPGDTVINFLPPQS